MKFLFIASLFFAAAASAVEAKLHSAPKDFEQFKISSIPDQGEFKSSNYGGYLPVAQDRQAYFYLVESENNPATDPVVLWLTGGPGCSSFMAMYTEMGPYTFVDGSKLELNPYRWTTNATMLWLDSPAGVGFSTDPNEATTTWTDEMAAEYNYEFIKQFFKTFPQFRKNVFHITGESYGGHYVPQLAEKIFDGDDADLRNQMRGWMVGNPCTGDIGCAANDPTLNPFLQYHGMMPLNANIPTAPATYDPYDILAPTCVQKQELRMTQKFIKGTPHLANAREKILGVKDGTSTAALPPPPGRYDACAMDQMQVFANRADVKAAIHAASNVTYEACSNTLNYPPNPLGVTDIYVKLMAKTNWSILVYSGLSDSIVNFVQTQTIINGLNLPLANPKFSPWYLPDLYTQGATQLGGYFLQFERMAWAGVRGAGHMVPQYTPPEGKELFRSYLETGKPGRLSN